MSKNPSRLSDCTRTGFSPVELRISPTKAVEFARVFKALGHPVRLQIMDILSRYGGQVCVCEIEEHFDLGQPTISHHLKVLRSGGLVDSEQRGLSVYYFIRPDSAEAVRIALVLLEARSEAARNLV
jgi:ArsR family transcriptional regulator